jgi:hypothetical protein
LLAAARRSMKNDAILSVDDLYAVKMRQQPADENKTTRCRSTWVMPHSTA